MIVSVHRRSLRAALAACALLLSGACAPPAALAPTTLAPAEWSPQRTCYKAEPWHFRYVGRDAARAVRESGLSLREWLWVQQPR